MTSKQPGKQLPRHPARDMNKTAQSFSPRSAEVIVSSYERADSFVADLQAKNEEYRRQVHKDMLLTAGVFGVMAGWQSYRRSRG